MKLDKRIWFALVLILFLGLIVRFHPVFFDGYFDPDQAFHIRQAKAFVSEQGVPVRDELSNQGRFYSYAPMFHNILAVFSLLSGLEIDLLIFILSALFGVFGILAVFLFARKLFDERIALFAAFILSIMALHLIRTAGQSRPDGLALLIIPFVLFFLFTERFKLAIVFSVFQVLLHPLSTAFLLITIIAWIGFFKFKRIQINFKPFLALILITFLVFLIWLFFLPYSWIDYVSKVSFDSTELAHLSIIALLFYTKEAWIFALIGFFKLKKNFFLKVFFVVAFAYAVIGIRLSIFLSIPLAIIAGFGFNEVIERVRPFQKIAFVIVLMLVLISITPGLLNKNSFLSSQDLSSLNWIREFTPMNSVIFAQWDLGHPITYLGERVVFFDGYFEFAPDINERNRVMRVLINSSDCVKIIDIVNKHDLGYFLFPSKVFKSPAYALGALEADCNFESMVYATDSTKIMRFS